MSRERAVKGANMKILMVAAEVAPFAKAGGLADVAASLPKALRQLGHDVRVILPRYGFIEPEHWDLRVHTHALPVPAGLGDQAALIYEGRFGDVPVYFVDNRYYFGNRRQIYGHSIEAFQFAFFCRAVAEFIIQGEFKPDVVHANDWHTGLLPVLVNDTLQEHPALRHTAVVFTIHNLAYQGVVPPEILDFARIDRRVFHHRGVEFYGQVNCMKAGLVYADMINTVSPRYAQEIQSPTFGEGLEGVLRSRSDRLRGILNGVDYEHYDPSTDHLIPSNYNIINRTGKTACKRALQRELGLPEDPNTMLVGIVSRMVDQKGFDLVDESADIWSHMDIQFAVTGSGQKEHEQTFLRLFDESPLVRGQIGFDTMLAQRIYAGADALLMPSRFEPCGLGQLIALRYGTVPIVRATGGLADTIKEFHPRHGEGTGFTFERYDPEAMLAAIRHARFVFDHKPMWQRLVVNCMAADYSWGREAGVYADFYHEARLWAEVPVRV